MSSSSSSASSTETKSPSEAYFARMLANRYKTEYMSRVAEMAEQNPEYFEISLNQDDKWHRKTYYRQRLTSSQYMQVEKLRAQYEKETDLDRKADALASLYKYLAFVYMKMEEQDFDKTDWNEIKPVIDSILFRAIFSFPNVLGYRAMQQQEKRIMNQRDIRRAFMPKNAGQI